MCIWRENFINKLCIWITLWPGCPLLWTKNTIDKHVMPVRLGCHRSWAEQQLTIEVRLERRPKTYSIKIPRKKGRKWVAKTVDGAVKISKKTKKEKLFSIVFDHCSLHYKCHILILSSVTGGLKFSPDIACSGSRSIGTIDGKKWTSSSV